MKLVVILAIVVAVWISHHSAAAFSSSTLSEKETLKIMDYARKLMRYESFKPGSPFLTETPKEMEKELITTDEGKQIIYIGFNAGIADWCDDSWKLYYSKFMEQEFSRKERTPMQTAYMNFLAQEAKKLMIKGKREKEGTCPPEDKQHIHNFLERKLQ